MAYEARTAAGADRPRTQRGPRDAEASRGPSHRPRSTGATRMRLRKVYRRHGPPKPCRRAKRLRSVPFGAVVGRLRLVRRGVDVDDAEASASSVAHHPLDVAGVMAGVDEPGAEPR